MTPLATNPRVRGLTRGYALTSPAGIQTLKADAHLFHAASFRVLRCLGSDQILWATNERLIVSVSILAAS